MTPKKLSLVKKPTPHFTPTQLAERWGMNRTTLANWRVDGHGPRFIKVGKKVLYSLVEIERYERERTQRSTVG